MKKIGIIGKGFVGSAVEFGFSAQTGGDSEETKILIMFLINKNSKYKVCSQDYEVESIHNKSMFYG